ncbi:YheE family protein [Mesobacillus harenae]|uniref:YheE family protein n=1 Tax=Mesobacillus harenae TaxID=2213203 RepID=UPI0015807B10|nr:YheE family protein [Mesobacillus harenae]
MITHFQFKPLFDNAQLPGWRFSLYFHKKKLMGIYHQDGKIEWTSNKPDAESQSKLESQIHELMLYHVYDK